MTIDLEHLKGLLALQNKTGQELKTCLHDEYPIKLMLYHQAKQSVVDYTNNWIKDQDIGLILFEFDDKEYSVKSMNNYKYIGYSSIKPIDETPRVIPYKPIDSLYTVPKGEKHIRPVNDQAMIYDSDKMNNTHAITSFKMNQFLTIDDYKTPSKSVSKIKIEKSEFIYNGELLAFWDFYKQGGTDGLTVRKDVVNSTAKGLRTKLIKQAIELNIKITEE